MRLVGRSRAHEELEIRVERRTEALREATKDFTPDYVAARAGIDAEDVLARRMNVVAQRAAIQIPGDIERGSATAEAVNDQVLFVCVAFKQVPDDVTGRGALVRGLALVAFTGMLRGIFPEGRRLQDQWRFLELHATQIITRAKIEKTFTVLGVLGAQLRGVLRVLE